MELYPAVDLLGGAAVRLVQGDFERRRSYGDPVEAAVALTKGGAPWLHVVDLDAARTGEPVNQEAVRAVVAAVNVPVQVGGGVRHQEAATALLDAGAARVVVGTAALEDPHLIERLAELHPGAVAVGLDHRQGLLAVRGWTQNSSFGLQDALCRLDPDMVAAVVITDIGRDGTMGGPEVDQLRVALKSTDVAVIASGGVRSPGDLEILAGMEAGGRRLAGAVVGKALHEGRMSVEEALAACAASG